MTRHSFAVRRTATGLGLVTLQPISGGKRIIEYVGLTIPLKEAKSKRGKYLFELDVERAIDGSPRNNIARYINHSCRPNAEALSANCRIWICAKKALKASEEITIDYGTEYFDELIKPKGCKCKRCLLAGGLLTVHASR